MMTPADVAMHRYGVRGHETGAWTSVQFDTSVIFRRLNLSIAATIISSLEISYTQPLTKH